MSTFAVISGTVDSDPVSRSTGTGKTVADVRVDTGEGWFTVTLWEKLAETLPSKGDFVVVTGKLRTRSYENKDKQKVYVTEVNASTIDIIGAPSAHENVPVGDLGFD